MSLYDHSPIWLRLIVEDALFNGVISEAQYREYNGLSTWDQMSGKVEGRDQVLIRYSESNGIWHYKASFGNLSVAGTANSLQEAERISVQMAAEFKVPYATIHKVYDDGKPVTKAEGNMSTNV
jgi:hypothetical protein